MSFKICYPLCMVVCVIFQVQGYSVNSSKSEKAIVETFRNPILDFVSPDPQAFFHNGFYYLVLSSNVYPYLNGGILMYKSRILTDFRGAQHKMIYNIPTGLANLWAPEIHEIDGQVYIYFAMDDGNNDNHRMYVIKADDPNDLFGSWTTEKRFA